MKDNKQSSYVTYDGLKLVVSCIPKSVKIRDSKRYMDWWPVHQSIQKGIRLLCRMAADGDMAGVQLVPTSIWYEKPIDKSRI